MRRAARVEQRVWIIALALSLAVGIGCGDSKSSGNENENLNNNQSGTQCGNGEQQGLEECDNGAANSDTQPDACRSDCTLARCGDGVTDSAESCDDGPANSDQVPDACRSGCTEPACGDGVVDVQNGELCDDGNTDAGDTCSPICLTEICGNAVIDPGEVCDDGNLEAGDGCSPDCQSAEVCGNGYLDSALGEACDEGAGNSEAPDASCRTDCSPQRCGDSILDLAAGEACDASELDGESCLTRGYYQGTLGCQAGCRFDVSGCVGFCGDGAQNGTEVCDGLDFGGQTCRDFGFYSGLLACDGSCDSIDTSGCTERCGDAVRNGNEVCDGVDFGGASCQSLGYYQGTLACDASCRVIDTGGCEGFCGDAVVNGPEMCDGPNQGGLTCRQYGSSGGALGCDAWCRTTSANCVGSGFVNQESGTTETLWSVWGSSATDVFAVGDGGAILHNDGEGWNPMVSGTTETLYEVWGFGPNDVWAVGTGGAVLHFDGTDWSSVSTGATTSLYTVWGSSPTDLYVGGYSGYLMHYDGAVWSAVDLGTTESFNVIWGTGPSNVYAGGTNAHLWQYDGSSWTVLDTGNVSYQYRSLWGWGPDEIIGVNPLHGAKHFDGTTWTQKFFPAPKTMYGVWGATPDNVWAVGAQGTVYHYDGTTWTNSSSNTLETLFGIWGSSASDIYAVGGNGTIQHYGGSGWEHPVTPGEWFMDLWVFGPDDFWVTGHDPGRLWYFDGATWTAPGPGVGDTLTSIWASGPADVWAVGDNGGVAHYDGSPPYSYTPNVAGVTSPLRSVWGTGPSDVVAVGLGGVAVRYDGSGWSQLNTNTTDDLDGLWASGPGSYFAVGENGIILHFDGTDWTPMESGTSVGLAGVWGTSPTNILAVGETGLVLRYDGRRWTQLTQGGSVIYEIWGSSMTNLFAVGYSGWTWRFNGSTWNLLEPGGTLHGVMGSSASDVFACGTESMFVKLDHELPTVEGGACHRPVPLYCNTAIPGSTHGLPGAFDSYPGCAGVQGLPGGEVYYRLENPVRGEVTVRLTTVAGDGALIMLGADAFGRCDDAGGCLGTGLHRADRQDFEGGGATYELAQWGGGTGAAVATEAGNQYLQLTSADVNSSNGLGFARAIQSPPSRVVVDFDFRFGVQGTPGNGLAMALLDTAAHGLAGPPPAFDQEPDLQGSLGIGLDIVDDGETFGDNHLSVHFDGAPVGGNVDPTFDLDDGQWHHVKLVLTEDASGFRVDVALTPNGGAEVPVVQGLLVTAPLYVPRLAFAAATGTAFTTQDVDNVQVRYGLGDWREQGISVPDPVQGEIYYFVVDGYDAVDVDFWLEVTCSPERKTPRNCSELQAVNPELPSGLYTIDPDGSAGTAPFEVYCDLETDGGGWTLIASQDTLYPDDLANHYDEVTPMPGVTGVLGYFMTHDLKIRADELRVVNDAGQQHTFITDDFDGPLIFDATAFVDAADYSWCGVIAGTGSPRVTDFQVGQICSGSGAGCRQAVSLSDPAYAPGLLLLFDWHDGDLSPAVDQHAHFGGTALLEATYARRGSELWIRSSVAPDCAALLQSGLGTVDGVYLIDPDGPGGRAPFQAYCDQTTDGGGWTLILKTAAGDDTLQYASLYWSTDWTLNSARPSLSTGTAKYGAYNGVGFDTVRGCVGAPSSNCLSHTFAAPFESAVELFDGPTRLEGVSRLDFETVFSPTGMQNCAPQSPGFNVQAAEGNHVRWGYANNLPSQPCQLTGGDSDGVIGFGISGQDCGATGAGWTNYFVNDAACGGAEQSFDAWIWVR
ncbi:MAG: fibrinogen-like YCDxxxxGGGW domain-containing protein [bacterium]